MERDSFAIAVLCGGFATKASGAPKSLSPAEWGGIAKRMATEGGRPADFLDIGTAAFDEATSREDEAMKQRIEALAARQGNVAILLSEMRGTGIDVVTRADESYPATLKRKLGWSCPPLFFYAGELGLLSEDVIGCVGSRAIEEADERFARNILGHAIDAGHGIVSGGARGIDSLGESVALERGAPLVEFVGHSLSKHIRKKELLRAVREGGALVLSASHPSTGFSVGLLMGRNKYIYAQSVATVVVRSDKGKGGTWSGATEALKKGLCPVCCWDNADYAGNQALIKEHGAIPLSGDGDGDFAHLRKSLDTAGQERSEQLSLF